MLIGSMLEKWWLFKQFQGLQPLPMREHLWDQDDVWLKFYEGVCQTCFSFVQDFQEGCAFWLEYKVSIRFEKLKQKLVTIPIWLDLISKNLPYLMWTSLPECVQCCCNDKSEGKLS